VASSCHSGDRGSNIRALENFLATHNISFRKSRTVVVQHIKLQAILTAPKGGLISDADNTLWNTDQVYADAQLWLLATIEALSGVYCPEDDRLRYVRTIDQALAKSHHAGLRYPSGLLAAALRKVLEGATVKKAVTDSMNEIRRGDDEQAIAMQFDVMLKTVPSLRVGVKNALRRIHSLSIPILVATEGTSESCRGRLEHWKLTRFVNFVLSAPKSRELYERAAKLLKVAPAQCIVVGDQLDRDMLFAAKAGCTTIYFPGGFSPSWSPSISQAKPTYIVDSFEGVVNILTAKLEDAKSSAS